MTTQRNDFKGRGSEADQAVTSFSQVGTEQKIAQYFNKSNSEIKNLLKTEFKTINNRVVESHPLMVGMKESEIKFIPFDNSTEMNQKELSEVMGERKLIIGIKNHIFTPNSDFKEVIKFQCTHAQFVVKTEKGLFTLNNPQSYESGLFGNVDYPSLYLGIEYPKELTDDEIKDYEKNILMWSIILNTVTKFPGDYNGGDSLSAKNLEEVKGFGDICIRAFIGDEPATFELNRTDNKVYCAELLYLALTLGMKCPITKSNYSDVFEKLEHSITSKDYVRQNSNPYIGSLNLRFPSDRLKPLGHQLSNVEHLFFGNGLAINPLMVSEFLTSFIKWCVPRIETDNDTRMNQREVFIMSKKFLYSMLPSEVLRSSESDLNLILDEIENIITTQHQNKVEFKKKIKESLSKLDNVFAKLSSNKNVFIPPHTFLIRALELKTEQKVKGTLGFSYLGHGIFRSLYTKPFGGSHE